MSQGVITLLYKGKGSKALLDSYRPITLLNSDYKLLAKALATRFGPALQHVVDPTQTAFVPGRWIGDNVLCHLEEVEYLQQTGQPGCMVFLDFSTAYDPRHYIPSGFVLVSVLAAVAEADASESTQCSASLTRVVTDNSTVVRSSSIRLSHYAASLCCWLRRHTFFDCGRKQLAHSPHLRIR